MMMRLMTLLGFSAALIAGSLAVVDRRDLPRVSQLWPHAFTQAFAQATDETPAADPATAPVDAPKSDAPKSDATKSDAPKSETPKAETPGAAVEPAPQLATPPAAPQTPAVVTAPPIPQPKPVLEGATAAAKLLFAAKQLPTIGKAMAIGYYPRGCLSGGVELPVNGPTWQVMRVSRNRNWGHPNLVRFLERWAPQAAKATGWNGILVGDMAQPRGGPLPFGHMSHQIGLDVDVWFMPMPGHTLSSDEREKTSATNLVADDWKNINPKTWTPQHVAFIRTAAEQPEVERVLVNAAIKKELCRVAPKAKWLTKVRPWYAHHDHIHVRLECPEDSPNCRAQPSVPEDDGCSSKALDYWFSDKVLRPVRNPNAKPPRPLTMADLPPACQTVLSAPARSPKN